MRKVLVDTAHNWQGLLLLLLTLLVGGPMLSTGFSGCGVSPQPAPVVPAEVHFKPGALASVSATEPVTFVVSDFTDWHADASEVWFVTPITPGPYHIHAFTTARSWLPWGKPVVGGPYTTHIVVDGPMPPPNPPVPPVPPVPPNPPIPPAPVDKPAVLLLYDEKTVTALPAAQQQILYGKNTRDYLDAKWPVGPDGKTHEWRIWPASVDASNDPSTAVKAMLARKHTTLPWIVISNGKTGWEGPLPASEADTLALLKKYGE